jgi:hypothetical protein
MVQLQKSETREKSEEVKGGANYKARTRDVHEYRESKTHLKHNCEMTSLVCIWTFHPHLYILKAKLFIRNNKNMPIVKQSH